MFTGIVEARGQVRRIAGGAAGKRLTIAPADPEFMKGVKEGDSVSVDGVCLTAVGLSGDSFSADVAPLTLERTTLGGLSQSSHVNLERAMAADSRFGGHIVSGHVDAVGRISSISPRGESLIIEISTPDELLRGLIDRGSVTVDGISLTVAELGESSFSVSIIPHTSEATTLANKTAGSRVNLEGDIIGKYVKRIMEPHLAALPGSEKGGLDMDALRRGGFA